jgi:hypothetical protein
MGLLNWQISVSLFFLLFCGCSIYQDVRADTRYDNGPFVNAHVTKPLSSFDEVIQVFLSSANILSASQLESEIRKKELIGRIIDNYVELQSYWAEIEIEKMEISNYFFFESACQSSHEKQVEKANFLRILSNEIAVKKDELALNEAYFTNSFLIFLNWTGLQLYEANMKNIFSETLGSDVFQMRLQKNALEMADHSGFIRRRSLDNFLPVLSLSGEVGYNLTTNTFLYSAGASLGYSFSEIFYRENDKARTELENQNLRIDNDKLFRQRDIVYRNVKKEMEALSKKIKIEEGNLLFEKDFLTYYISLFQKERIDFYYCKSFLAQYHSSQLALMREKNNLFLLNAYLSYGILKDGF